MSKLKNKSSITGFVVLIAASLMCMLCSCDSGDQTVDSNKNNSSGKLGGGALHYSGKTSGTFKPHSVQCTIINGNIKTLIAPADTISNRRPSFTKSHNRAGTEMVTFTTKGDSFFRTNITSGLQTAKKDGQWILVVDIPKVGSVNHFDDNISLSGKLICGSAKTVVLP